MFLVRNSQSNICLIARAPKSILLMPSYFGGAGLCSTFFLVYYSFLGQRKTMHLVVQILPINRFIEFANLYCLKYEFEAETWSYESDDQLILQTLAVGTLLRRTFMTFGLWLMENQRNTCKANRLTRSSHGLHGTTHDLLNASIMVLLTMVLQGVGLTLAIETDLLIMSISHSIEVIYGRFFAGFRVCFNGCWMLLDISLE